MKILYDHQIFTSQVYGGISRYFAELMKNFENHDEIECEVSLKYSNNNYLKKLNNLSYKTFLENYSFGGKYRLLSIFNGKINRKISEKKLLKGDFDIFHPTYYNPYFLNYLNNKPFILTIYDMIHEIFQAKDKTREWKKLLAQKAVKIIAISENTKKDIVKYLNIAESKIEVIYLGNSFDISSNYNNLNTTLPKLPKKYILFVAGRKGYKNFNLFIEAISTLLIEDNELFIVCAGGGNFSNKEIGKFKKLNIKDKIFCYLANDSILAYLYQKATAFVFPSIYEGFGIPILESFACRCPLICSKTSSFPEVAGDAAIYFDPTEKLSMLNSIQKVIYNDELKKQLINKGIERVKKFTWIKTAEKTKKLYEKIL